MPATGPLLVGIGGGRMRRCSSSVRWRSRRASEALLLPAPCSFATNEDLRRSARRSAATRRPMPLYDAPRFHPTFGSQRPPCLGLSAGGSRAFVAGLRTAAARRRTSSWLRRRAPWRPWTSLVGRFGRRIRLLARGLSRMGRGHLRRGPASCPSSLTVSTERGRGPRTDETAPPARTARGAHTLISRCSRRPWGIRIGLSARGIPTGPLPLPLTAPSPPPDRGVQRVVPRLARAL